MSWTSARGCRRVFERRRTRPGNEQDDRCPERPGFPIVRISSKRCSPCDPRLARPRQLMRWDILPTIILMPAATALLALGLGTAPARGADPEPVRLIFDTDI